MQVPDLSFRLRDLALAPRLVIALFLISVGLGYFSALVQLHFQYATSGKLLPGAEETSSAYHGRPGMSMLERLLRADESQPFNGTGSMRQAFFSKSARWNIDTNPKKKTHEQIEKLRGEREGEIAALLDWITTGLKKDDYENDNHLLPSDLAAHPATDRFLVKNVNDEPVKPTRVKIKSIFDSRCVRCHSADKGGIPAQFPLDTYEDIQAYAESDSAGGMPLARLAQTTHVHLLGFSMLFGLTGLLFAFTSYPRWIRVIFGPFTLAAQLVDIGCWWLSRYDPVFTYVMLATGSMVAIGLFIHIVFGLWDLFSKTGRIVLLILMLAGVVAGAYLKFNVIDSYLAHEKLSPEIRDINKRSF
jgi:mono/diheme cytochrome c family protein